MVSQKDSLLQQFVINNGIVIYLRDCGWKTKGVLAYILVVVNVLGTLGA